VIGILLFFSVVPFRVRFGLCGDVFWIVLPKALFFVFFWVVFFGCLLESLSGLVGQTERSCIRRGRKNTFSEFVLLDIDGAKVSVMMAPAELVKLYWPALERCWLAGGSLLGIFLVVCFCFFFVWFGFWW